MAQRVQKVRWREARGEGRWSDTIYEGFFIPNDDFGLLLADLSHGLRMIEIRDRTKFSLEVIEESAMLEEDVIAAHVFMNADQLFQRTAGARIYRLLGKPPRE